VGKISKRGEGRRGKRNTKGGEEESDGMIHT